MGQALIRLTGVVVGALLSGDATYLMARRVDSRKARAAARLLEAELQPIARSLAVLQQGMSRAVDREAARKILHLPDARLWEDHQSVLAEVLGSDDWYALAAHTTAFTSSAVLARSKR